MKKKFPNCSTLRSYSKYEGENGQPDRRRLFEAFIPLARHRAKRFLWSGFSLDELTSVACIGLGDAIENYDPETYKNGLAAYAIPWIDGALKRWITQNLSIVIGERNEEGKYKPKPNNITYFGNVAKGDGQPYRDISLDEEVTCEADNNDDEDCGGSRIDTFVDHKLEAVRGDYFEQRLKKYRGGIDLKTACCAGEWRWIGHSWLDHDTRVFYAERREFYRRGVGYFLRSRRMEKRRREILPYKKPAWPRQNTPIKFAHAEYYRDHRERMRCYERLGFAPYVSKEERNASQPNWKRPTPKRKWAIKACAKLKAEHATLFWSDDNLSNYEIWSERTYLRVLHQSYRRPYPVPWLTATHVVRDKNQKPVGRIQHSPYLIGESDYGFNDVGFCLENWTALDHIHKRRVREVNQEIVLKKPINRAVHFKPDSRLVLLFWARHIIIMHYLTHWLPMENQPKQAA